MLSDAQRVALLRTARAAIVDHLVVASIPSSAPIPDPRLAGSPDRRIPGIPEPVTPAPPATGVFVTIKRRGQLRGCLGVLEMRASLDEEVARCARDSATADPRFSPMTPDELPDMSLEISVLGPLEEIDPLDDRAIVIGRHGLLVEQGLRRGLLLPQVAPEWGWTREQFLQQTCRKAHLPENAWRAGARVFRFDAEVFGDET
jgi:AmmeMemoRadiSam system protein A